MLERRTQVVNLLANKALGMSWPEGAETPFTAEVEGVVRLMVGRYIFVRDVHVFPFVFDNAGREKMSVC